MSDSDDSDGRVKDLINIKKEIDTYKKNPDTSQMFVSGWDDADQDIDVIEDPKANPVDHVLWAAENGNLETLKDLLQSQMSLLHVQDADGYSVLHRAAYGNHLETVSYLLSLGANVSMKTELGWTPLHSACNWNNYTVAARLLAAGTDPRALSDGEQTPMHLASAKSHSKSTLLILFLLDDTVNIASMKNNSGETPLDLAKGHGIYGPMFEMVFPAACYIKSLAFTCNPYATKWQVIGQSGGLRRRPIFSSENVPADDDVKFSSGLNLISLLFRNRLSSFIMSEVFK